MSEFYRSKANADGYDGRCKACDAIQCSERRKKKPRIENPTVDRKARCLRSDEHPPSWHAPVISCGSPGSGLDSQVVKFLSHQRKSVEMRFLMSQQQTACAGRDVPCVDGWLY